ncbi:hypothetical protein GCM10027448_24310 [Nocardioides dilutus]
MDERPRDGDHFPAAVTTEVPPGGTSMITTPDLAKDVKTLVVVVKPKTKNIAELEDYDRFVSTMGSMTKGKRLLTCVFLYQALVTFDSPEGGELQANGAFATIAGATLLACLQLAGLIKRQQARSSAAAEKCGAYRPSIPATVTQDANGYRVAASGQPQRTRKPKLKVKCTVTGDTVRYTIRPRKKGQSLRKAAGKKLMVGLRSPADAQNTVPVQVTFSTP